jgi:hypothetical protein
MCTQQAGLIRIVYGWVYLHTLEVCVGGGGD